MLGSVGSFVANDKDAGVERLLIALSGYTVHGLGNITFVDKGRFEAAFCSNGQSEGPFDSRDQSEDLFFDPFCIDDIFVSEKTFIGNRC